MVIFFWNEETHVLEGLFWFFIGGIWFFIDEGSAWFWAYTFSTVEAGDGRCKELEFLSFELIDLIGYIGFVELFFDVLVNLWSLYGFEFWLFVFYGDYYPVQVVPVVNFPRSGRFNFDSGYEHALDELELVIESIEKVFSTRD